MFVGGGAKPAVRAEVNPTLLNKLGIGLDTVRTALPAPTPTGPRARFLTQLMPGRWMPTIRSLRADQYRP